MDVVVMIEMGDELKEAARSGNVDSLKTIVDDCESRNDYSCLYSQCTEAVSSVGNIFHLAAWGGKHMFFQEAVKMIPQNVVHQLLCHQEQSGDHPGFNPLHVAAMNGHIEIVKQIVGFYNFISINNIAINWDYCPSRVRDGKGSMPSHLALQHKKQDCALEILTNDYGFLRMNDDSSGNSHLFLAVQHGCEQVVLRILDMASQYTPSWSYQYQHYTVGGQDGSTALHFAPNCSEQVFKRLVGCLKSVDNIQKADKDGRTIMHQWLTLSKVGERHVEYVLKQNPTSMLELFWMNDNQGDNVFHTAVKYKKSKVSKILAQFYMKQKAEAKALLDAPDPDNSYITHAFFGGCKSRENADKILKERDTEPWVKTNNNRQTPLQLAFADDDEAVGWFSKWIKGVKVDFRSVEFVFNALAEDGNDRLAENIWDAHLRFGWIPYGHLHTIFQIAHNYSEEAAEWVAEKLSKLELDMKEVGEILLEASTDGLDFVVETMLTKFPSALKTHPLVWKEACENGHLSTLLAFINNCTYFRDLCSKNRTTPLHHIKLSALDQYEELIKNPVMVKLKNFKDSEDETPLHKAVAKDSKNIELAEALLKSNARRNIKDSKGRIADNLLARACQNSNKWDEMCRRNNIVSGIHQEYIKDKNAMFEVRNTQSVVAALLATITFTAGFTLPGGFNSNTGEAVMGDKAAFLAFLISNAFAMCCSMLTLVFLIWSLEYNLHKSWSLIQESMIVLKIALCSTIVAFMTGVYTVLRDKSLWAAILILVMCSLTIILANQRIKKRLANASWFKRAIRYAAT